jgi:hypothetical protein
VAKTHNFPSKIILVSGAKPKPEFHLADVPIWRSLQRIDNMDIVAESGQILKRTPLLDGRLSLLLLDIYSGYGAGEIARRGD